MSDDGTVTSYNATESLESGLSKATAVGRIFFSDVAPYTNSLMVAERFKNEPYDR